MAVVIEPTENRLAMAKPAPKKLDPQEANQISDARKMGWKGESSRDNDDLICTLIQDIASAENAVPLIARVRKFGKHWRQLAKR